MQVHFVARENGPERLVTEAEIHFDMESPLAGTRLVGFCLWKSPDGEIYVTFPSRAFGAGSKRRYFDYLRAINGDGETVKRVKAWILDECRKAEAAEEVAVLTRELARATGLGGRIRSFADAPERARTAVQKAVKRAIDEITAANPTIGQHLAKHVETGVVCCYRPERA